MADKLAVITGASTGIGFELASLAAEDGYDLVVVADEALIDAAAADFRRNGNNVVSVEADLSTLDGVDKLLAAVDGRPIDVLCANAGISKGGAFLDQDFADVRHSIDTNITGTVYLLQKVLAQMTARQTGKILVTGSIAGYVPGPFNATYNATKAFVDNFTDALRDELKDYKGVTLTTLKPGATDTEFFARADMLDTKVGQDDSKADPAKVAKDGWTAMQDGKDAITSGWFNKLQVAASGITPAAVMAHQHRKIAEPGSGKPD
ncbi:Oxidoreductase [Sphingomonas antarctica]|uniref:SDR family NAD(P)-dependent oxidoreductase n=1 Tax=Sphingomonas antarctica TaxID=2040274 RepID=UPI0039E73751